MTCFVVVACMLVVVLAENFIVAFPGYLHILLVFKQVY